MGKQETFASMAWQAKGKVDAARAVSGEMDAVIPWARLLALIEPHYPKAGKGVSRGLEKMLRIHFLQQWFNLSDPQAEDAIYDSESIAAVRASGAGRGRGAGRDLDPALSSSVGAARADRSDLRRGARPVGRAPAVAARRDHRRCDDHRGAEFDQEYECGA